MVHIATGLYAAGVYKRLCANRADEVFGVFSKGPPRVLSGSIDYKYTTRIGEGILVKLGIPVFKERKEMVHLWKLSGSASAGWPGNNWITLLSSSMDLRNTALALRLCCISVRIPDQDRIRSPFPPPPPYPPTPSSAPKASKGPN